MLGHGSDERQSITRPTSHIVSSMMRFSSLVTLAVLCGFAAAYPTETPRALVARDCSAQIKEFNFARREKRNHSKRTFYPGIRNFDCLLAAETPLAHYVPNPPVRQNVTEGQPGIPVILDIGVLDVTTCEALPNVMVEIWSTNSQGEYGTFLRGAFPASSTGIAEFFMIFPGHTAEGANHINVMVHTSSKETGSVSHVGQIFFTDDWTKYINMYGVYASNTQARVLNDDDPNYVASVSNGYIATADILSIGDDWPDPEGVVGYITVGVDSTAIQKI